MFPADGIVLAAATAWAQGNPTGAVSGQVVDPDGLALPGVKANYFLSTSKTGSHNFVVGFDVYKEMRKNDNYQTRAQFLGGYPVLTAA